MKRIQAVMERAGFVAEAHADIHRPIREMLVTVPATAGVMALTRLSAHVDLWFAVARPVATSRRGAVQSRAPLLHRNAIRAVFAPKQRRGRRLDGLACPPCRTLTPPGRARPADGGRKMTSGNQTRKVEIAAAALAWQGHLRHVLEEHQRLHDRRRAGGSDYVPATLSTDPQRGSSLPGMPNLAWRGHAFAPVVTG